MSMIFGIFDFISLLHKTPSLLLYSVKRVDIIILNGTFIIFIKLLPSNPVIIIRIKTGYNE